MRQFANLFQKNIIDIHPLCELRCPATIGHQSYSKDKAHRRVIKPMAINVDFPPSDPQIGWSYVARPFPIPRLTVRIISLSDMTDSIDTFSLFLTIRLAVMDKSRRRFHVDMLHPAVLVLILAVVADSLCRSRSVPCYWRDTSNNHRAVSFLDSTFALV